MTWHRSDAPTSCALVTNLWQNSGRGASPDSSLHEYHGGLLARSERLPKRLEDSEVAAGQDRDAFAALVADDVVQTAELDAEGVAAESRVARLASLLEALALHRKVSARSDLESRRLASARAVDAAIAPPLIGSQ